MRVDTLGLQAFIAIADCGGFQKAAAVLHLTQTALTRRLQNLESLLGVTLVERTTRSVALTPTGRDFLPQGRRLLNELTTALIEIRETGKARRGDVSIACVPSAGVQFLPKVIERYSAQYPENRIKILDHASSAVADAVLRREAEFGINIAEPDRPELTSAPLLEDRFVLICRHDHPLAKRTALSWKRLATHRLIFAGAQSNNRPLLDHALSAAHVSLRSFYEVQRSSTALGLVAAGVAAAVVPRLALQPGAYPTIRIVPLANPVVSRKLVLISRRKVQLSPAAQALRDMIREEAVKGRWT
jgi:DNA-binding transcriptional LysR family regulator